jgi:hypothetical protein
MRWIISNQKLMNDYGRFNINILPLLMNRHCFLVAFLLLFQASGAFAQGASWKPLSSGTRSDVIGRELDRVEQDLSAQRRRREADPVLTTPRSDRSDMGLGSSGFRNIPVVQSSPSAHRPISLIKDDPLPRDEISSTWTLSAGYRRDELDWNIAGNSAGNNPNVALENSWDALDIYQIKSQYRFPISGFTFVDAMGAFGFIQKGNARESVYSLDNRQNEFLQTLSRSDDGNTMDFSLNLGYNVFRAPARDHLELDDFRVSLLGGYSYHQQNLTMTDGVQTIDTNDFFGLGPFPGLDNTYDAVWLGPWLGFEIFGRKEQYFSNLRLEYHWADYKAEGDLNLRPDLNHPKSFQHDAEGQGFVANWGIGMHINPRWQLSLNADYQEWSTKDGIDQLFYADGTTQNTRLNEVTWSSYAFMMAATYRFE